MLSLTDKDKLIFNYKKIRQQTIDLCTPLTTEDYVIQGCDDVSPPKWHLAHTTWFFETFILNNAVKNYSLYNPVFQYIFNSYYQGAGIIYPRQERGILSRPTVDTVLQYRQYVDNAVMEFIEHSSAEIFSTYQPIIEMGFHHEQQHQELIMMDIKYNFSLSPEFPKYHSIPKKSEINSHKKYNWIDMPGGIVSIGHNTKTFCYDNELPLHHAILRDYRIANRLITNGEYLEFIQAGGYQQAEWWLSDGWDCVQKNRWSAPLYWQNLNNEWYVFSLTGLNKISLDEPAAHVSYFEADAFAKWCGTRLPTEMEWEYFALSHFLSLKDANFLEKKIYTPQPKINNNQQIYGDVWEWTSSPYLPYPGYQPLPGILGEYNGKFMNNQMVLRGGSCVTPASHIRPTYRNFFAPDKRWAFSGIRLAL